MDPDSLATFDFPRGCVMDYEAHRLYVVDYNNHAIRIIHLSEITGFKHNDHGINFEIYPNPSGNEVQINGHSILPNLSVRILNSSGQLIREEFGLNGLPIVLNIADLEAGIYYVELLSNKVSIGAEKLFVLRN